MIRKILVAAALGMMATAPVALAQDAAPAAAKYNITSTLLSDIWADEAAKAAFTKVFPEIAANPQLEQGMGLNVTEIAGYAPDVMTPEKLKELEAELAKIK
jgi:hypothetical protein